MDIETALPLLMFVMLFLLILGGFPVAFVLAGTGLLFGVIGQALDLFSLSDFGFIPIRLFGIIENFTLIAVPLFIFMGITLEKSGIAEELLTTMERAARRLPGGLTIAIIIVGALLAASTGIVGATVVTMGVLSLPTMISRGYDIRLSTGCIAASGTLGQIIPPSIVLVLLGDLMNIPVAKLFAASLFPGLLLVLLYLVYVIVRTSMNPSLAPPLAEAGEHDVPLLSAILRSLAPPLVLMLLVLGTILAGLASPTEAAGCGAFGALLIAAFRRRLSFAALRETAMRTTTITSMVFTLLIGAQLFSIVFRGLYGDEVIVDFINHIEASPIIVLAVVMLMFFVLGCFLDFIEICFIVVPVVAPLLIGELGFDGTWIAVLIAVNLQTSFLTPPFGFALFYLRGVAPAEVRTGDIYRGIVPFVLIQLVALGVLWLVPDIATFLPHYLFGE